MVQGPESYPSTRVNASVRLFLRIAEIHSTFVGLGGAVNLSGPGTLVRIRAASVLRAPGAFDLSALLEREWRTLHARVCLVQGPSVWNDCRHPSQTKDPSGRAERADLPARGMPAASRRRWWLKSKSKVAGEDKEAVRNASPIRGHLTVNKAVP